MTFIEIAKTEVVKEEDHKLNEENFKQLLKQKGDLENEKMGL